jgi:predicted  nucleic acid-binding Zn-ribbon protein
MSRPFFLHSLQKIDSKLDENRSRLQAIEATLANNSELKQAENKAKKTENNLNQALKILRSAETKVKDQRLKIEQNEATLYSGKIRNPKELQDLQNEVAALKRYLEILEDRQLEAMLNVDDVEEQHNIAMGELAKAREETEVLHRDLLSEKSSITKAVQALEKDRLACLPDIIPADLKIYDRLRKTRAGVAVAKVNDQACAACGATLTASTNQAARSPSQVTTCETCGRILYTN